MELRHLRYFVGVARELNFTRAARKLNVAQPALSRQIRQLEEEVGVPLLDRHQRGVRLTNAGQAFLVEAEGLLQQSKAAIRVAQDKGQSTNGQLNIGYIWALHHSLAPPILHAFHARFPDAAVNLFDMTSTEQATALTEGKLDVGFIGFGDDADLPNLKTHQMGSCRFLAALPSKHAGAKRKRVGLKSLASDFFFDISEQTFPGASHVVSRACREAGFKPKVLQTTERGFTILGLVAANCGVAILPEPLKALPHPGVVFRPLTPTITTDLFLAWNPSHTAPLRSAFLSGTGHP